MSSAREYRELASEQRRKAEIADLPMVRLMYAKAADRWERLAEEIEYCDLGVLRSQGRQQTIFY